MKSQAEIIGEYVLWAEKNSSNNLIQSMAYSFIRNAEIWFAEMQKEGE